MPLMTRRITLIVAALTALFTDSAHAQTSGALMALGYSSAGAAAGLALTAGASCSGSGWICVPPETVAATLGGAVLGLYLGAAISSSANRAVAEGAPLSRARLTAVTAGTVLGGATTGALASALLIQIGDEGTILGSDEQTFAILTVAGAALAALRLSRNWGLLTEGSVAVQPTVLQDGRTGLVATVGF